MDIVPESIESLPPRPPKLNKDSASMTFLDHKEIIRNHDQIKSEKGNHPPPLPPKDVELSKHPV